MKKAAFWLTVLVLASAAVTFVSLVPKKVGHGPQASLVVEAKEGWKKEVRSGDGKIKLLGTNKELPDGRMEYVFRVVGAEGKETLVFRREVGSGVTMEIPFNSWSPDNKQFFLEENDGQVVHYLVYKENGGKYGGGLEYLDINEDWSKSKNNYVIKGVTGWEGNDLLRVTTSDSGGVKGPSFWFVISSRGFLRLRS